MTRGRRRLFWKIYLTLLASLVVTTIVLGAFFWFLGEAEREAGRGTTKFGPSQITEYAADGHMVGARGRPISQADKDNGPRHGPFHVVRLDLPDGGYVLARFGAQRTTWVIRLIATMFAVVCGVGLAAYPVTALLTRRLEALRAGVARWGEGGAPIDLDDRGSDEVALLARAFKATAGRLDALLASQRALLANASHELRSPLARLRVAIEVGGREEETTSRRAEIVRNLAEMDELVDELLLSSRLEHVHARQERRDRVDLLGLAAEEAARYDARVGGDATEVVGDAVLLRRLMRNLLENGMRHGEPPVTISISHDAQGAVIGVTDGGRGVAPRDRNRIFEPFYRPAGSSEGAGGWGLGLALVRQIAEHHGGSAACVPDVHSGSRFVIHLATSPETTRS